jgi:hypothetical protein
MGNAYRILIGRPEYKRQLGRPRLKWEDNIQLEVREIVFKSVFDIIWVRTGTGGGLLRTR